MFSGPSSEQFFCDNEIEMQVKDRQWRNVATILRLKSSRIRTNVKRKTIEKACEHEDSYYDMTEGRCFRQEQFLREILLYAEDSQLEGLLNKLIERKKWGVIPDLLKRNISSKVHRWAIVKVCTCATDRKTRNAGVFERVLAHVDDNHLEDLLVHVLTAQNWGAVPSILDLNVSVPSRAKAVEEACHYAVTEDGYKYFKNTNVLGEILLHADVRYVEEFLRNLVAKQKWGLVPAVLRRRVNAESRRWAVLEAFKLGYAQEKTHREIDDGNYISLEDHFVLMEIFAYVDMDQTKTLLELLIERKEWKLIPEILQRNISDDVRRWAVEQCIALDLRIEKLIDYCADDQADFILQYLAARCDWKEIKDALASSKGTKVSDSCRKQILEEAAKNAPEYPLSDLIQFYTGSEGVSFVSHLVERQLGHLVDRFMTHCKEKGLLQIFLSQADSNQLDSLLRVLVTKKEWRFVLTLLNEDVSPPVRMWTIEETCKNVKDFEHRWHWHSRDVSNENEVLKEILSLADNDHLEHLLKKAVIDREWDAVLYIMNLNVSEPSKRLAVEDACFCAVTMTNNPLEKTENVLGEILSHAHTNQLDDLLRNLVVKRNWFMVPIILNLNSVSTPVLRWTVEEACTHANKTDMREEFWMSLLDHCAPDQADIILQNLAACERWRIIVDLLRSKSEQNASCRKLVLEMAGKNAVKYELLELLPCCKGGEGDCLMFHLVKRGLWKCVGEFIDRNDSGHPHRHLDVPVISYKCTNWAIVEMLTHDTHGELLDEVDKEKYYKKITEDIIDTIIEVLVARGMWYRLSSLLKEMRIATKKNCTSSSSHGFSFVQKKDVPCEVAYDIMIWIMDQALEASKEHDALHKIYEFCPLEYRCHI